VGSNPLSSVSRTVTNPWQIEMSFLVLTGASGPTASIPVALFLKNEKGEEFVARYVLVNGPNYGPFTLHAQAISVARVPWSKSAR
jgi:hypothetical protein